MERLTYKYDDKWCISGINGKLISDKHANYWGEAIDRLAAYENAGIEPCDYTVVRASYEEAERAKKDLSVAISKLGECMRLLKAEEQGRLVVLPCKMKDTLFMIKDGEIYSGTVRFLRWEYHKDRGVRSDIAANPNPYFAIGASFDDFGKTVFLTREEAEAALKGE